jgi:hypothetical protein
MGSVHTAPMVGEGREGMEGKHGGGKRVIHSVDEALLYIYGELEWY